MRSRAWDNVGLRCLEAAALDVACRCSAVFAPGEEVGRWESSLPASQPRVRHATGARQAVRRPRPPSATQRVLHVAPAPAPAEPRAARRRVLRVQHARPAPDAGGHRTCASVAEPDAVRACDPPQAGGRTFIYAKREKREASERTKVGPGQVGSAHPQDRKPPERIKTPRTGAGMSQHIGETGEAPEHPHTAGARLSAKASSVGTGGPFLRRRGDDWPAAREAKVFSLAQTHARA